MTLKDRRIGLLARIDGLNSIPIEKRTQVEARELAEAGRALETVAFEREIEAVNNTFEERRNEAMKNTISPRITTPGQPGEGLPGYAEDRASKLIPEYRDTKTGQPVYVLNREQRLADIPDIKHHKDAYGQRAPLSIGKFVRGWLTGKWADAEAEQRAMGGSLNSSGGFLVSDPLSASVIDLARAKSVMFNLGARTVDMPSDTLAIARVAADPTFGVYNENSEIAESAVTFDRVNLVAMKIATIIVASRELLEDAPNAATAIENSMAAGLAAELDRQMLDGSGSGELTGLYLYPGLNEETSVGAPTDYTELIAAYADVLTANGVPNGYVMAPRTWKTYEGLLDGVGGGYLQPPASIAALNKQVTKNIPLVLKPSTNDSFMLLGDFTTCLLGVRRRVEVAMTDQRYFEKDQIGFRITTRVDLAVEHPTWLTRLIGVTA